MTLCKILQIMSSRHMHRSTVVGKMVRCFTETGPLFWGIRPIVRGKQACFLGKQAHFSRETGPLFQGNRPNVLGKQAHCFGETGPLFWGNRPIVVGKQAHCCRETGLLFQGNRPIVLRKQAHYCREQILGEVYVHQSTDPSKKAHQAKRTLLLMGKKVHWSKGTLLGKQVRCIMKIASFYRNRSSMLTLTLS